MGSRAQDKMVESTVMSVVSYRCKMIKLVGELYERISKLELEKLKLSLAATDALPAREERIPEEPACPIPLEVEDSSREIAELEEELTAVRRVPRDVRDVWDQPLDLPEVLYVPHTMRNVDLELEF